MAFGNAGPSTIFASIVFHWAPNALMPSAVIRSTTCDGTRVGGICGAGGAGAAAGTCAPATVAIIMGTTNTAQAMNLPKSFLRISSSRFFEASAAAALLQGASTTENILEGEIPL